MKRFLVVAVEFALISWAIGYGSMGWFVDAKWFGWLIGIAVFVGMWQWFLLPRARTVLVGLLCVPWTLVAFGATFGATAEWWWPYQWSTSLMAALFGGAIAWSIHE